MRPRRHLEAVPSTTAAQASPLAAGLVLIASDELERRIEGAVRRALAEHDATPPSPPNEWIDADEAAAIVGCTRDYLRRVRDLPRHGSARTPRYRRSEVEAFVLARAGRPLRPAGAASGRDESR